MRIPNHHPDDQQLQAYAAGRLSQPLALLVSAHASLCSKCAKEIALYEAVGGELLLAEEGLPVSDHIKTAVMSQIKRGVPQTLTARVAIQAGDIDLPPALQAVIFNHGVSSLEELDWRQIGGYAEADLTPPNSAEKARLLRIAPGAAMPQHTHEGSELTLVLQGSFADETGTYSAGDFVFADSAVRHTPKAFGDIPCLCLAVTDAKLKLTGPIGRYLNPLLDL